ncbi:hypothetical protein F4802DRAFT_337993 [Xylaria palmicola]|nr:hypothetical protein F4802DRAFT_337993 [Xylaria palmicola]
MPRILPWKRREHNLSQTTSPSRSSPVQRVKQEAIALHQGEVNSTPSSDGSDVAKETLKRPRRHNSTSPPPEPPPERFMIEGIDGDDRYRMVEDEFLAMAQQFTAHLHAAEYKRLKTASELENAQTIENISRPVVGQMTHIVKVKRERKALGDKQRLARRKLRRGGLSGDESTETDDPDDSWQKQSLYGLMESPTKRARRLDRLPSATSVTRAAAGFDRQTTDIVSPSRARMSHRVSQPSPSPFRTSEATASDMDTPVSHDSRKAQTYGPGGADKVAMSTDENMDFIARLKKRQAERRQSREQRKSTTGKIKSDSDDILPDFL